jgi:hypothetical protein
VCGANLSFRNLTLARVTKALSIVLPCSVSTTRRGSLQLLVRDAEFILSLVAEVFDAVSAVKRLSNLLVCLNEALELAVKFSVLSGQHVAVVLQGFNLSLAVVVATTHGLVGEAQVVLLSAGSAEALIGSSALSLQIIELSGSITIAGKLAFGSTHKIGFLLHFEVESTALLRLLVLSKVVLVSGSEQVSMSFLISFSGSPEIELLGISEFRKVSRLLLRLVKVVVRSLDSVVGVRVLALFHGVQTSELVDLFLVSLSLLFELSELVVSVVEVLGKSIAVITFLGNVSLGGENLSLTTVDLFSGTRNLSLQVVVLTVLLVEEEASVIDFFAEGVYGVGIGIVSLAEVIVLQELLILQVAVLGLDSVKLVAQSQVVLVALLDLEDLSLQLGDEQVFLVTGQMHAVVVLQQ